MPKTVKSEIGRTSINEQVRMKLWAVSGGRCEICNRLVYSDTHYGVDGNFGELAHIHAVSPNGPRHKYGMTCDEKNDIAKLMLLCEEHHHLIDTNPENYPDDFLVRKKLQHEERIRALTEISDEQSCRIVTYFSNIDNAEVFTSESLLKGAAHLAGYYPKQDPIIKLHKDTNNRYIPARSAFENKALELEYQFNNWFDSIVKEKDTVALFALAPQPLLFKLGTLLNDQYNVKVFQRHRTGHMWAWIDRCEPIDYQFNLTRVSGSGIVALVIDLSAPITDERIVSSIGDATIYHITIPEPCRGFVKTEAVQDAFVSVYRTAMEKVKNDNPGCLRLNVFMAMPNSLVIRAGMDYMPKADLPITLFDLANLSDGFFEALNVGG